MISPAILQQAFYNVTANKRRTIFVLFLIGISVCALLLFNAFVQRVYWGVRESVVRSQTGHLQIMSKKYDLMRNVESSQTLFDPNEALLSEISKIPNVLTVTRRVEFKGLIGYNNQTTLFSGIGVEPREEAAISSFDRIIDGRALSSVDQWRTVVGNGLAHGLGAAPGDSVIVTTVMPQGGLNAADFEIVGITQSDSAEYDQHILKIPLVVAQKLLNTTQTSKVVLLLDSTDKTEEVKQKVQQILARFAPDLMVKDWRELNPQYDKIVALYSRIFGFMAFALVLVSILSIGNVMSMSFLERIREFSVMRTIGMRKFTLVNLLMAEGASLALLASVVGIALAWLITWIIGLLGGLSMPPPPGSNRGFSLLLELNLPSVWQVLWTSILVGIAACVLVAWRAVHLQPAQGLRHA
jgi:putative ABC transport system permease protein